MQSVSSVCPRYTAQHVRRHLLLPSKAQGRRRLQTDVRIAGSGYLSAFPTEHFDRLQNLDPDWAPFYVLRAHPVLKSQDAQLAARPCVQWGMLCTSKSQIHKIMAGLLDQYRLAGHDQAYSIALGMADWVVGRVDVSTSHYLLPL